ncbi:SUMF1/EgtB/PvdO family nonheme iron enzyme [candidate division KSB1 bacterium]|nr:SUMF1/EgtB/PvdO family nonheme iron enzyme [candidate division KSB1 bacterium]
MKYKSTVWMVVYFMFPYFCFSQSSLLDGFVAIQGGTFRGGDVVTEKNRLLVRVDDFEMLDHPVTNAEYKRFVDATGHSAPLHWNDNQIPAGKEDYPVIFVNRHDVKDYLKWLTKQDGRIYRLPTIYEFEYASRGGLVDKKYPWGEDSPKGKANYDTDGNRAFDRWSDYLKPARFGKPNGYCLYGMAGNIWHLTVNLLDPATVKFKYQIEDVPSLEGSRMGGSWARSAEYLRCGNVSEFSSGIRHPDAGFRPIREPDGVDWRIQPRKLCAVMCDSQKVFLSWAILKGDAPNVRFNVYRTTSRNHAGFLLNKQPITESSSFVDNDVMTGERYHYYIRSVDGKGNEGRRSEWIGITASNHVTGMITSFQPVYRQGSLVPIFGDLNGDGSLDCVIRLSNGNHEMSQDPGIPVQLEAFNSFGRSLWRRDICYHDHCYGSANNVPFNVWDMDADGKSEIITRMQIGDSVFAAILDGMTGDIKSKTPWPKMATDYRRSSTRIHLSIAYLDGKNPAIVTQTGLYENEVFVAFDAMLNKLWQFNSFAETNGSAGHKIEVADVDGDGKQEVFDGTTCLNHDGAIRWSIYRQHPDVVSIHDFLPERPGLEVFYVVESNAHAGAYMVDANSGEVIWKVNRDDDPRWTHGHVGWTADVWDGAPGIECISNRAGHNDPNLVLFSAHGKILLEPFPNGYYPIEWNGDPIRELLSDNGHRIGSFNGTCVVDYDDEEPNKLKNSSLMMVADLYGDFRDELVLTTSTANGRRAITVVTALKPIKKIFMTPTELLDYRLWLARNMGGGYPSIYDQPLLSR